ncbi:hypothetical protein SUDANB37_03267 [Streptomyces sp. enrichment culture]
MTRVWQWNRPVTVREVLEDLQRERSIAYTTVMTVLDNLHQKGWVRREVVGRAYRYTAVSTRAAYSAALMNEAWSQSDNPAAALVAFFGMMSPGQREALNDAIRIVQRDTPERAEGPEGAARPQPETPGKGPAFTPGEAPNAPPEGTAPDDGAPRPDESGGRGKGQGHAMGSGPPAAPQSDAERPVESPAGGFPSERPTASARSTGADPSEEPAESAEPIGPGTAEPAARPGSGSAEPAEPAESDAADPGGRARPHGGPAREGGAER